MEIVIYIFVALFLVLAVVLVFAYKRTGHHGLLLMGFSYGATAALAIVLGHWWPLAAGFVLVWLLRLLGLEPEMRDDGPQDG